MLILLPPSETKRPGGRGRPLALDRLALPSLSPQRTAVVEALVRLSDDPDHAMRVLRLSERQRSEVAVNALLRDSPTMPALDRYTGVLFDALSAATLSAAARRWMGPRVFIHSAPFGPVGALDPIPAYRLAAGSTIPGLPSPRALWSVPVRDALAAAAPTFVLDLRSEAYRALGPLPDGVASVYLRVVTEGDDGVVRALNHFNKHAKGALVRSLAESGFRGRSRPALLRWAREKGWTLRHPTPGQETGELELVV